MSLRLEPALVLAVGRCHQPRRPHGEATMQPFRHHQVQFAGFYAADQNGLLHHQRVLR